MKKTLLISKIMLIVMLFAAWNVSAQDEYHIQEGFSSSSLPDGWSGDNYSMGSWSIIPNLVFTDQTNGIKMKVEDPITSWIQLPPVNGVTDLSFSTVFRDESGNLDAKLQSSPDGETWTDIVTDFPGLDKTTQDPQQVTVSLNIDGVVYLRFFAFTTDGVSTASSGFYLDDVQVGKPAAATDDASLAGLYVDSTLIDGFDFDTRSYTMEVSHYMGYTVQAEANSPNAAVDITQVSDINGSEAERTATVVVTSEDATVTETTTIVFTQTDYWFKEGFDDSNDLDGWERNGVFQSGNWKDVPVLNQYPGDEFIRFTRGHETGNNEGDRGYLLSPKLPNLGTLTFWAYAETVLPEHQLDVYLKTSDTDSTLAKSIVGNDLKMEWQEVVVPIESEDSVQIRIVGTCDINDASDSRIWMDDFLLTYYEPPVIGADDATLSALYVGGNMVDGFSSDVTSYTMDVTPIMDITVTAEPTNENATVDITQATNINGTEEERTATVVVTSADESATTTTTIVFTDITSGVEGFQAPEVVYYPNPAADRLNIQVPVNAYQNLEIFNITGQKVRSTILTSTSQTIDIASLSEGVYIMSFTGEAGTHVAKFIKE